MQKSFLGLAMAICLGLLLVACADDSDGWPDPDPGRATQSESADEKSDNSSGDYYAGDADADADGNWDMAKSSGSMAEDADIAVLNMPSDNEGDKYEAPGSNPFVMVAYDPFSTFAADVDTASYDILRRDINNGMLPQPDSVRLEEYVNYFSYDYPAPAAEDEHPFAISLAAAPGLFGNASKILRVGIQAVKPPPFEKKPTNLVFLIDTSGSMSSSDKLPLVQHVLTKTLDVLDPTDTVSIVTYAGSTGVALEPTPVSEKDKIAAKINSFQSGGSTAGAGGIELAYQQAEAGHKEGGINHVILCTDGDFNVGLSTDTELVDLIEQKRKTGITLTVIGFGTGNLNDSMMEKVSNAGNGIYAVISSESHADSYVEDRMLSTINHIAKDMKIQVEFNPEKVYAYRLLGYENRAIADEDFRDDTVDAGEVGEGHRVTALYELIMVGDTIPEVTGAPAVEDGDPVSGEREIAANDMVLVKVRYKDIGAKEGDAAYEVSTSLGSDAMALSYQEADTDLQWAAAVAAFAEILKESPYADESALGAIESIVTAENWLDGDRSEFKQLFLEAKSMIQSR